MKNLNLNLPDLNYLKISLDFDYFQKEIIPMIYSFDRASQSLLIQHQFQVKKLKSENGFVLLVSSESLNHIEHEQLELQIHFKDHRFQMFQDWDKSRMVSLEGKEHNVEFIEKKRTFRIPLLKRNFNNCLLKLCVPSKPIKLKYQIESNAFNMSDWDLEESLNSEFKKSLNHNQLVFESEGVYYAQRRLNQKIKLLEKNADDEKILIQSMPLPSVDETYIQENELVGLVKLKM